MAELNESLSLSLALNDEWWTDTESDSAAKAIEAAQNDLNRLIASLSDDAQLLQEGGGPAHPFYLILSSKSRLTQKYGHRGFSDVDGDIRELKQAIENHMSIETIIFYVDDVASLTPYGLQPVDPTNPAHIEMLIGSLEDRLGGGLITYILIVGGDEIIPFHSLPNPVDDQDEQVLSDNPYASRNGNPMIPDRAIGRLPNSNGEGAQFLRSLIQTATEGHRQTTNRKGVLSTITNAFRRAEWPPPINGHSVGYSASIWRKASRTVFKTIGETRHLRICPPLTYEEFKISEPPLFSYFNLHGVEDGPNWYGQRDSLFPADYPLFPVALRPQELTTERHANSIVFSEACYGAHTVGKNTNDSIALRFLASQALALVGSTKVAYGAIAAPLIGADLIGQFFWQGLCEGLTVGEALRFAKIHLAKEMEGRQGYLDGEDQKTLLSFVLYGDPSLPAAASRRQPVVRYKSICPPLLCKKRVHQPKNAISGKLLSTIEKYIESSLPHMAQAQVRADPLKVCSGQCSRRCSESHKKAKATVPVVDNWAFTLEKDIRINGDSTHHQMVKIVVDQEGHILKMAMSK
jgi:hypothetical protein